MSRTGDRFHTDQLGSTDRRRAVEPARVGHRRGERAGVPGLVGFAALLRARARVREAGVAFRVTEPSPALRRLADVGGVGEGFLSDW